MYHKYQDLENLQNRMERLETQALTTLNERFSKFKFLEHYREFDPNYITKEITSLTFLLPEKERLEQLSLHPAFYKNQKIIQRLNFLNSAENRFSFLEEDISSTSLLHESLLKQQRTIEIDAKDLENLLSKLEGVSIGSSKSPSTRPQIIITDFQLDKIDPFEPREAYKIQINCIKREFFKKVHS